MGFLRSLPSPQFPRSIGGLGYAVVLLLVLFSQSNAVSQAAPKQRTQAPHNDLQQHYDAGRTFQLSGDQARAAAEYKTFLAEALRQIGNAWMQAHEFEKADTLFKAALTVLPRNADVNLNYAALRLEQGNPKEAQVFAEAAITGAPEDPQAQYMLGSALFQQQDYKGAREHLEKAVVASPKFQIGYLLGLTYIKLNDLNRATVLFNEMVIGLGDTPEIHVLFGRAYREGDFLDQAVAELKKAIQKDSKTKMAHYLLAMAYLERDGDSGFAEAVPELDAELRINPQDARTHYMVGYIALKRHDTKLAESELTRAAELDPGNPDPLISLGQLYADSNRLPEAEKTFRRAILLTKDPARNGYQINRAHYSLGRILLQTGREEEGKKELQISAELRDKPHAQARGSDDVPNPPAMDSDDLKPSGTEPSASPENAKKIKAFADELRPAIADSYNNLGVIAAGTQDFVSAMDYFAQAGEWNPNLQTLDRNKGMAAFYANRFDAAVEPLSKHVKQQPDDLRARAALGLSLFGMKRYGEVLETLQPIKKDVDGDPGLSYAYAVSQVKAGAYPEGIARLRALEKADPRSADVHTLLGEAFVDQGEYAEALDEYHLALAINPGLQRTHFLAGLALIRQGNPTEAAEELRTALKLDPTDVGSKYHLAFSLIQMQKQEEAVPLLREVIQQDPKYADAYYQLGKLQLEQGDTGQAISNLETGTRLNPDSDYTHYQLALAYRRQSRTGDAEREMQTYRALKNRHRGRDAAQQN
jgi:tetratricopeptide (TPR) repeat protein